MGHLPHVHCVRLDDTAEAAKAAFAGVDGVYLLMPRPVVQGGPMFGVWLAAIVKCKVQHVVLHSAISAAPGTPLLLATEHYEHRAGHPRGGVGRAVLDVPAPGLLPPKH